MNPRLRMIHINVCLRIVHTQKHCFLAVDIPSGCGDDEPSEQCRVYRPWVSQPYDTIGLFNPAVQSEIRGMEIRLFLGAHLRYFVPGDEGQIAGELI